MQKKLEARKMRSFSGSTSDTVGGSEVNRYRDCV